MKKNKSKPLSSLVAGSQVGTKQVQAAGQIAQRAAMYFTQTAAYQSRFRTHYNKSAYPYYYTPYGQREFRVFVGGGGTSAGAGAGDVWRPQGLTRPQTSWSRKTNFIDEEYVQELIRSYQTRGFYASLARSMAMSALRQMGHFRRPTTDEEYNPLTTEHRQMKQWRPTWMFGRITSVPDPLYWRRPFQRGPFRPPYQMSEEAHKRWLTRIIRRSPSYPDDNSKGNEQVYPYYGQDVWLQTAKKKRKPTYVSYRKKSTRYRTRKTHPFKRSFYT